MRWTSGERWVPSLCRQVAISVSLGQVSACYGMSVRRVPAEPGFCHDRGAIAAGAAPVRRCKAIFLPWVPASAESSAPCPRACGGTAPASKLMRWLRIRVNHLPAKCCRGVCEFLAPLDTPPCTRLSCSRPKLLHQMFCNKNPKPHESSQVSYVIITPNSGLPRVSVVL